MPWYNGNYAPSYKNQPRYIREKTIHRMIEILLIRYASGIV